MEIMQKTAVIDMPKRKKKISEYERFIALTDAEKDAEVAIYDKFPHGFPGGKPLRKSDKALHRLARARGRVVAAGKIAPAERAPGAGPPIFGIILIMLFTLFSISCHHALPPTSAPVASTLPAESVTPIFDGEITDVIAHADHRISRRIMREGKDDFEHDIFLSHRVLGPPNPIDPALQREISTAIVSPDTYDLGTQVLCFEPGVRYEFYKGNRLVAFDICFSCRMLRIIKQNDMEKSQLLCFIPGYNRLLKVTKEIFPNDPDIQKITDKP